MSNQPAARTDFSAAIAQIASERKITPEAIVNAIKAALVSAYRKQDPDLDESLHYFATVDEISGESRIFSAPILEQDEETLQVLAWDEKQAVDVTPAGFGRIAAQTAKQVILQKIRESEKEQILGDFQDKIGEIVTGTVLRMDGRMVVIDVGRGQAYMPPEEQMRGEFYRMNMRITVLIKDIRDMYRGKTIVVSRADRNLVAKLFEREVPEVASGAVEIAIIAREAGVRTKLAVKAGQDGVDPVGSCVGQRGVRVQEVIKELNNEKIDIIPYTENINTLLQGALAPAESLLIKVDETKKMAIVTAPDEQLSLAIGKGGQNVRLAAKLTGYRITIQSAGGDIKSEVTGQEEHEIDTIAGLSEETRAMLIMFKLTTVNDLVRFQDKWQSFDKVTDEQKALLQAAVEVRQIEDEQEAAAYHARHAAKQASVEGNQAGTDSSSNQDKAAD